MTRVGVIWDDGGMQRMPLGDYELFEKWSGRPRSWGAGGEARVWFGGQVVDGLCTVLDEHLAATGGSSAAIGCVPWLTITGSLLLTCVVTAILTSPVRPTICKSSWVIWMSCAAN